MIKIECVGKVIQNSYSLDEFIKNLSVVKGCHISLKYLQNSGLRRVLYLSVQECGALKDTYTDESMTAEEIWRIHEIF